MLVVELGKDKRAQRLRPLTRSEVPAGCAGWLSLEESLCCHFGSKDQWTRA